MKFKKYIDDKKTYPYEFAKKHNIDHVMVWRAYKGKAISPQNAMILSLATRKKVKILDLIYEG
ncbi:MAG: hypothetical protein WC365_09795 [Candidatus Babeliales bacterium]|jgi:hypothetical protein